MAVQAVPEIIKQLKLQLRLYLVDFVKSLKQT